MTYPLTESFKCFNLIVSLIVSNLCSNVSFYNFWFDNYYVVSYNTCYFHYMLFSNEFLCDLKFTKITFLAFKNYLAGQNLL